MGGLRALAAAGRLGVLNTWGAKGVFHWRSRHHWATVGLQELDFELAGLPGADVVLAVGLDEEEAPERLWSPFPHASVTPELLGPLAERWGEPGPFPDMPPLRDRLAAVTQAGWAATGSPLMPSLVTRHYAAVFGHGGLVAADPGTAGFWVARTFATTRLGTAFVPANRSVAGPQPASSWRAWRRPGDLGLAVVDGPLDERSRAVLEQGRDSASRSGSRRGRRMANPCRGGPSRPAGGPGGRAARRRQSGHGRPPAGGDDRRGRADTGLDQRLTGMSDTEPSPGVAAQLDGAGLAAPLRLLK